MLFPKADCNGVIQPGTLLQAMYLSNRLKSVLSYRTHVVMYFIGIEKKQAESNEREKQ